MYFFDILILTGVILGAACYGYRCGKRDGIKEEHDWMLTICKKSKEELMEEAEDLEKQLKKENKK